MAMYDWRRPASKTRTSALHCSSWNQSPKQHGYHRHFEPVSSGAPEMAMPGHGQTVRGKLSRNESHSVSIMFT